MSRDSECEESLRYHTCQGPLHKVIDNGESRVICMGAIKTLILKGHEIDIEENVPRKFKKELSSIVIIDNS